MPIKKKFLPVKKRELACDVAKMGCASNGAPTYKVCGGCAPTQNLQLGGA